MLNTLPVRWFLFLLTLLFAPLLGYCQFDIIPHSYFSNVDVKKITEFKFYNSDTLLTKPVAVKCNLFLDSVLILSYTTLDFIPAAKVFCSDSNANAEHLFKADYYKSYLQNNKMLWKGTYLLNYVIADKDKEIGVVSYSFSITKSVRDSLKNELIPLATISINNNFGWYGGEVSSTPNRDMFVNANCGTTFFGVPLNLGFSISTNYKTVDIKYLPIAFSLDAETLKKSIQDMARNDIAQNMLKDKVNMNKIRNYQEMLNGVNEKLAKVKSADIQSAKEFLEVKKFLKDTLTQYIDSLSKIDSIQRRVDSIQDFVSKKLSLDSIPSKGEAFKKNVEDSILGELKPVLFKGENLIKKYNDSLLNVVLDKKKQYEKLAGIKAEAEKIQELVNKKEEYTKTLETLKSSLPISVNNIKTEDAFSAKSIQRHVTKSPLFTKFQKYVLGVKQLKIGVFPVNGPELLLGNCSFLGLNYEAVYNNVYTYILVGNEVDNPTFDIKTSRFKKDRVITAAGVGYQYSDDKFIKLYYKFAKNIERPAEALLPQQRGVNAVIGLSAKYSFLKDRINLEGNFYRSATTTLTNSSLTSSLNLSQKQTNITLFKSNGASNTYQGTCANALLEIIPTDFFALKYKAQYTSLGYESFGYELQQKGFMSHEIETKINPWKFLTFNLNYKISNPQLGKNNGLIHQVNSQIFTSFLGVTAISTTNLLLERKKMQNINSTITLQRSFYSRKNTYSITNSYLMCYNGQGQSYFYHNTISNFSVKFKKPIAFSVTYNFRATVRPMYDYFHNLTTSITYTYKSMVSTKFLGNLLLKDKIQKIGGAIEVGLKPVKHIKTGFRLQIDFFEKNSTKFGNSFQILLSSIIELSL